MERFSIKSFIVFTFMLVQFDFDMNKTTYAKAKRKRNTTCGIDKSPTKIFKEGTSIIQYYPWMGYLIYPIGEDTFSTAVVLVAKQLVIANANEIDRLPKKEFRTIARVFLGRKCTGPAFSIREYSYHPQYKTSSYNELALIQLNVDDSPMELRPICPPPTHFIDPEFFAMSFATDCSESEIRLHRMRYVDIRDCQQFYDNKGLDQKRLWPTYSACAKALDRIACIWRSGTVLVVYQRGRWLLLGFGVYGPGCSEPARFIDYGMYHGWVKTSIARMGRAAVTRLGPDHIIMRRSASRIQRFGPCDVEEMTTEIYTDMTNITVMPCFEFKNVKYNVTLYANVEYSCVTFFVEHLVGGSNMPYLYLRRWCFGDKYMCHEFDVLQIDFYVEVYFAVSAIVYVAAYGRQPKFIDPMKAMERTNVWARTHPQVAKSTKDLTFKGRNLNWYFKTPWPEGDTTSEASTSQYETTTPATALRYYDVLDQPMLKRADSPSASTTS